MADVFGTPVEQIIFQGTQLLQGAIRARTQLAAQQEQFAESVRQHKEMFQLQKDKLQLEREELELRKQVEAQKVAAGTEDKPLDAAQVKLILDGLSRKAVEKIAPLVEQSPMADLAGMQEDEVEKRLFTIEKDIADVSDFVRAQQARADRDKQSEAGPIAKMKQRRDQILEYQRLIRSEAIKEFRASPRREVLFGGGPEVSAPLRKPGAAAPAPEPLSPEPTADLLLEIPNKIKAAVGEGGIFTSPTDLRKRTIEQGVKLYRANQPEEMLKLLDAWERAGAPRSEITKMSHEILNAIKKVR